ncbi:hypothetical protein [Caballeronia arvi]|uniref:hypothetical protein n=1 Tax=Caballeronia arvi TaxID=1777135 RepID=UPI001F243DFE|nr:hypothetical protein [Caballeronia arvi]
MYRTSVHIPLDIRFHIFVLTGRTITLFPEYFIAGNSYLDYVVKMALDSSLTRDDATAAHQKRDDADEAGCTPGTRPAASGISVRLWDEIAPEPSHAQPPLEDELPEA